jgi:hypothetical protein
MAALLRDDRVLRRSLRGEGAQTRPSAVSAVLADDWQVSTAPQFTHPDPETAFTSAAQRTGDPTFANFPRTAPDRDMVLTFGRKSGLLAKGSEGRPVAE